MGISSLATIFPIFLVCKTIYLIYIRKYKRALEAKEVQNKN